VQLVTLWVSGNFPRNEALMNEDEKRRGLFEDDELDEEIRAADDTGMVAQQQEINAEEALLPEHADEDSET